MTVVVLVPHRDVGCDWRRHAAAHTIRRLASEHQDWELVTSTGGDGPWSKGRAVANARALSDADVLVVHDADSFVDPDVLRASVDAVARGDATWAVPHSRVHRLTPEATDALYDTSRVPDPAPHDRPIYTSTPGGGITVIAADTYDSVPLDARFTGWGGEDYAWGWALQCLAGRPWYGDTTLWHCWHPPAAPHTRTPETRASRDLLRQYRNARTIPRLMRAVIAGVEPEPKAELATPIRFRSVTAPNRIVRATGRVVRFRDGIAQTDDADMAEVLTTCDGIEILDDTACLPSTT